MHLGLGRKESLGLEGWAESDFKIPLSAAYWTICILLLTPSPVEVSLFSLKNK